MHFWGTVFENFEMKSGFKHSVMHTCIQTRKLGASQIILSIHVKDQAIVGPNKKVIAEFKKEMNTEFEIRDVGPLSHILGVEVKRDRRHRVMQHK